MRKLLAVLFVLLVAAAFVAGYWPQQERVAKVQAELAELRGLLSETRARLAEVEAQARLGRLFGQLLAVQDAVASGNFGDAQNFSSVLFDQVREEAGKTDATAVRSALEAILMRRDSVTAALARGEGSVSKVLAPIERELRRALGYPVPPPAPSSAGASEPHP